MKKTKWVILAASLLTMAILLTSCSSVKPIKTFDQVLEIDYDFEQTIYGSTGPISELDAYSLYHSNNNIAVFSRGSDTNTEYKVYNIDSQKVILDLSRTNVSYSIDLSYVKQNVLLVSAVYYSGTLYDRSESGREYFAYDTAGNLLESRNSSFSSAPYTFGDLIIFNGNAFELNDKTGALESVDDIPDYALPASSQSMYNDDYYYFESANTISIYDRTLFPLYSYSVPSYAENAYFYMLNDGKVLTQFSYKVEENAISYDYYSNLYGETVKYKLITYLIDPEKKTEKKIDFDYVISDVNSRYSLNKSDEDNPLYAESFENIAYICPIVDKKIDSSKSACDVVLMDNKGKISKSLKLVDGQLAAIPKMISEDRYLVDMIDGSRVLTDSEGIIIETISSRISLCGSYFVSETAIYDHDLEVVYDVYDTPQGISATIIGKSDNAVFVSEKSESSTIYYSFMDGKKRELYETKLSDKTATATISTYGLYIRESGVHAIYNALGEELITLSNMPTTVTYSDNAMLYTYNQSSGGASYPAYFVICKK